MSVRNWRFYLFRRLSCVSFPGFDSSSHKQQDMDRSVILQGNLAISPDSFASLCLDLSIKMSVEVLFQKINVSFSHSYYSVICDTIRHVLYTGGKTLVLSFRQKNNQADIIHQKKVIARRRELRRNWESRNSRLLPRLNVMASFQRWLHFPTSNTQESRI